MFIAISGSSQPEVLGNDFKGDHFRCSEEVMCAHYFAHHELPLELINFLGAVAFLHNHLVVPMAYKKSKQRGNQ